MTKLVGLQIHWFSIFNSFMMVIFLTGLVSMILLRTLRADYARYTREDDDLEALERDMSEESGWKLVHGDVFRPPKHLEVPPTPRHAPPPPARLHCALAAAGAGANER